MVILLNSIIRTSVEYAAEGNELRSRYKRRVHIIYVYKYIYMKTEYKSRKIIPRFVVIYCTR